MNRLELFAADEGMVWPAGSIERFSRARICDRDRTFPPLSAMFPHPRLPCRSKGHAMEPVCQELRPADRAGSPGQDQEGGLESILRGMPVADDLPTNAEHHRPMATHECRKCGLGPFVPIGRECRQQLRVAHFHGHAPIQETLETPRD